MNIEKDNITNNTSTISFVDKKNDNNSDEERYVSKIPGFSVPGNEKFAYLLSQNNSIGTNDIVILDTNNRTFLKDVYISDRINSFVENLSGLKNFLRGDLSKEGLISLIKSTGGVVDGY